MAESLFHQARNNGSLGIIFSVSAAAPETIASMKLSGAERAVLDDATACASYLQDNGVPKSLMEGSDKRVAVCRRILQVKDQSKLKSLMRKFLGRMATNDGERKGLASLARKTRTFVRVPVEEEASQWDEVSVESDTGSSIASGVSAFSVPASKKKSLR